VADISGNIRLALAVPLICYAIIASLGLWATRRTAA
jgi:FHS family L-fucose permease-like MFS transporter